MKLVKTSLLGLMLITLMSFTSPNKDLAGTYGVTKSNPTQIELVLENDHTFTYKDFTNPKKHIDVSGNWESKGRKVILSDYDSKHKFHSKWKITKDGTTAKSQNGLTFYRLVRLK